MKHLLLFILLVPLAGSAQKFALLDRDFKRPVVITDTLTSVIGSDRRFPVYIKDIDSLILFTEQLARNIYAGKTYEDQTVYSAVGSSWFLAHREKLRSVNKYYITLNTRANNIGSSMELVSNFDGNRAALQKIYIFLDYLRNNRLLIKDAMATN